MLLANGEMMKNDVIEAFNAAVANPENVNEDGSINWNFVHADMFLDLKVWYESEYLDACFEELADLYEGV